MTKEIFDGMIIEFSETSARADALRSIILDENQYAEYDMLNRDLMIAQLKAMEAYISILSIRLGVNGHLSGVTEDSSDLTTEEGD